MKHLRFALHNDPGHAINNEANNEEAVAAPVAVEGAEPAAEGLVEGEEREEA